ncbi:MAG TPA: zinc ribbon domain-containing protein [Planctomycetes bacterium]|nr:zinc ribbon domain-containing protein [Planctomycetota bacterium]HIK59651.1 zinc ribbon domain-containing protein [Planctomycetota bacterium]
MPTYDYRCRACGHELEMFQSMSEGPKRKCPECGTLKLQRLIGTGAGILFKGSGFYETDYRSASYEKDKAADKPPADKSKGDKSGATPKAKDAKASPAPKKDKGSSSSS